MRPMFFKCFLSAVSISSMTSCEMVKSSTSLSLRFMLFAVGAKGDCLAGLWSELSGLEDERLRAPFLSHAASTGSGTS